MQYTYDPGDRITQIADSVNGTITRQYDDLNRLTEETTPEGTVDYSYDAANRRTSMTAYGQTAVSYDYDNANRLTSITQGTATASMTYDAASRRSTLTYPNGIVASFTYDNANHLAEITYTVGQTTLGTLTYTYDSAGNRTTVGGSWARTGLPSALTSATYDAANRIVTWGNVSSSYDLNGNLTSDGVNTYTWNARNQLTGTSGATATTFSYDGLGRRRARTTNTTTTRFLYDGVNVAQEIASEGTPTAALLTGLGADETLTRNDGDSTVTLLRDALNSTIALADATGTVQTEYTYSPFGATTVSGSASLNQAQFTGRENDNPGLYYYRARYYDPDISRFISEDPLCSDGSGSLYAYVEDSPTNLVDPSGKQALPAPSPGPGVLVIPPWVTAAMFDAWILQYDWGQFQQLCAASGWAWCSPSPSPNASSGASAAANASSGSKRKNGKWHCTAKCNVENFSNLPNMPGFVTGEGWGNSRGEAELAAEKDANTRVPRGTYKRHCGFKCEKR